MPRDNNISLLEPISHVTNSLPFSFHHTIVDQNSELVLYQHWHDEIEFLIIVKGETCFCIEGNDYLLKEGDAIFIPPNLLHMAKKVDTGDCEFYAFVFSPSYISESCSNPHYAKYVQPLMHHNISYCLHLTSDISWQNNILNDIRKMYHLSLGDTNRWELQLHGMLLIIWQLLYNNHLSKIILSSNYPRLKTLLDTTLQYIHNSFKEEIRLSHLANISNMSEGQFCRCFKQLTGSTPFSYLNRYRILQSCKYLCHTSKKITEIATLSGFNNISYYNREFIKIMGLTPSSYRRINHDNS